MTAKSFVIIGSGVAGGTAAMKFRSEGFDGRVVVVGDDPGPPCTRPPLSKQVLRGEAAPERANLRPEAWFAAQSIELISNAAATSVDVVGHSVTLADGTVLGYDRLLLATGGRACQLPNAVKGVIHTLRTVADSMAIARKLDAGRSVIVLGAGFIGAEVASSARQRGCEVTIIEGAHQPMARVLPEGLGVAFAELQRSHGVRVMTDALVRGVSSARDEVTVSIADGRTLTGEVVVAGLGMMPNVELAVSMGIDVGNGILVDEFCRTTAPDVFAAGDVANHPNPLLGRRIRVEHWQNAQHQAAVAARNMLGEDVCFAEVPWVWTDQYELNIQVAGDPLPTDEVVELTPFDGEHGLALLVRDGRVTSVVGVDRADAVRAVRHLLASGRVPIDTLPDDADGLVEMAHVELQR
jgi:3-phenylpropionate/trans-cinnamate dioxygenase ferredoxin reductase component